MSLPERKSPRLKDYDYSQSGGYFVTICTHERKNIFAEITENSMTLSNSGKIANQHLAQISTYWENVHVDSFVVMPNHIHVIVFLKMEYKPDIADRQKPVPTLGRVIGNYKSGVTRAIRQIGINKNTIWQSRYHDHIIRTEHSLSQLRQYILTNPSRWQEDKFYNE